MEHLIVGHQVTMWAELHTVDQVLSDHRARKLMSTAAPHHQRAVMYTWLGLSRLKSVSYVTVWPKCPDSLLLLSCPLSPGCTYDPMVHDECCNQLTEEGTTQTWSTDGSAQCAVTTQEQMATTPQPFLWKQQEGKPSWWTGLGAGHLAFHFAWKEQWSGVHYTQNLRLCPHDQLYSRDRSYNCHEYFLFALLWICACILSKYNFFLFFIISLSCNILYIMHVSIVHFAS